MSVAISSLVNYSINNIYYQFVSGVCMFITSYLALAKITHNKALKEAVTILKNQFK